MSTLMILVVASCLIGSALVGGVFLTFSSFVMKALARLPSREGITAMQSINIVVINPIFLGLFMGTAVISIGVVVMALDERSLLSSLFFLGGALSYFCGTFLVTMLGNVPLNNQLATVSTTDSKAAELWKRYLERWTMWNHVRTVAAIGATFLFTVGFVEKGFLPIS